MVNSEKVYQMLRQIPLGKITTYKEIANKLDCKAYRRIGQIVGSNKDIPNTPCHRVVNSNGKIGGYAFGVTKKISLLKNEKILVKDNKIVDFNQKLHRFNEV